MAPPSAIDVEVKPLTDVQGVPVPDPLTINGVPNRRGKSLKFGLGVAAFADSDMFKSPQATASKPKAKRWDHRINLESSSRKPSSLKGAAKYLKNPGMISLGGGLPSSEYFPIEHIDFKMPKGPHFSEEETKETGVVVRAGKHDIREGKDIYDLSVALNYGQGTGSGQLLRFVTEHTEIVHNPPYADWHCSLTSGSTSALEFAYRMFCHHGDYVLTEEYTFATAVETATPMGIRVVGVKMDAQGLLPWSLDEVVTTWDERARGGPKPWLLYTVPSGQNPTGATQGASRRKEIYAVCRKHDIFIIEDEPYYFLQMQPYTGPDAPPVPLPSSHEEFLKALVPSFLSMDVDGRVLRLDSFSKVIAPGTRTGWVTASEQIVERFIRHHELSTQNPSGISQILLYKMLDVEWGHAGYLDWLLHIRQEYTDRRDSICHACDKYLPRQIASWNPPAAGMFHWIRIDPASHPSLRGVPTPYPPQTLIELEEKLFLAAVEHSVLVSRGSWFRAEKGTDAEVFLRATFAAAPKDMMEEAIRRLGVALRESFGIHE